MAVMYGMAILLNENPYFTRLLIRSCVPHDNAIAF